MNQRIAGGPHEIIVYPDTPHAFHAYYRASYRPKAANDGWQRLQSWVKQPLEWLAMALIPKAHAQDDVTLQPVPWLDDVEKLNRRNCCLLF